MRATTMLTSKFMAADNHNLLLTSSHLKVSTERDVIASQCGWIKQTSRLLSLPALVVDDADGCVAPFVELIALPRDGAPVTLSERGTPKRILVSNSQNPQALAMHVVKKLLGVEVCGAVPVAKIASHVGMCGVAFVVSINASSAEIEMFPQLDAERLRAVENALRHGFPGAMDTFEQQGRSTVRDRIHRIINRVHRCIEPHSLGAFIRILVGQPRSFLDIACGDDPLFLDVARKAEFAVGNDLAGIAFRKLGSDITPRAALVTAFDAVDFPRTMQFEVTLAKCLIHHLNDWLQFRGVVDTLAAITSGRIVVIDMERPTVRDGGVRTAGWNWYYRKLLNDAGRFFPGSEEIFDVLCSHFGRGHVAAQVVPTPRGRFAVACIDL